MNSSWLVCSEDYFAPPFLGSIPQPRVVSFYTCSGQSHPTDFQNSPSLCSSLNPSSAITSLMRLCESFSQKELIMTSSTVFQLFTFSSIMAHLCSILYYSLRFTSYFSINCKRLKSKIHDTPFLKSPTAHHKMHSAYAVHHKGQWNE